MVAGGNCTLCRIADGRAETVAFGRFLSNDKVTPDEVLEGARRQTQGRVGGLHVLAIQDTSELNFEHHAGRIEGLGPAGNGSDLGLFVHPILAVEAETGTLLGLAGGHIWTRSKRRRKTHYKQLPIEKRESYRWLEVGEQSKETLAPAAHVTIVADRESDIYEEWARLPDETTDLLTRAARDRRLADGGLLFEAATGWKEAGRETLTLRAQPGRAQRDAEVAIKFGVVSIARPGCCRDREAPKHVDLTLVEVREIYGPRKAKLHWRLLTTHTVETLADAKRIIDWYRQRWHIEQFFRTLKTQGLNVEDSQMASGHGLLNLAAMACAAAVCVMQLVYGRDGKLNRPATDVIPKKFYPLVNALQKDREGRTKAQKCPHTHGTLAWLAWVVARLGGWSGYASEKSPGPKTMTNGWNRFTAMTHAWSLAKNV